MSEPDQSPSTPSQPEDGADGLTPSQPLSPPNADADADADQTLFEPTEAADGSVASSRRELQLVKGGHRYVFRYQAGQEERMIEDLKTMGQDPSHPLTMYDAAMLSHQLGQGLGKRFEEILNL